MGILVVELCVKNVGIVFFFNIKKINGYGFCWIF